MYSWEVGLLRQVLAMMDLRRMESEVGSKPGRRYGRENTQTWTDDKLCLMPSCTELRCLWLVSTCRVHAYMHAVHGRSLKVSLWI